MDLVFKKNRIDFDEDNPPALLKKIMLNHLREFEKSPLLTSILFQEEIFNEYPDIKQRFYQRWKANEETMTKLVESGQKDGYFRKDVDPLSFTMIYMGSIRMNVFRWKRDGFSYELEKAGVRIVTELFKMLMGNLSP